jgi:ABC-type polar amino acid transport system ATPase subunit
VAMELLNELGVASRSSALPRQLSGGEAQRVAIARALAVEPGILLMDEPTSALDPARRGSLGQVLRQLSREHGGRGILIATHDVDFAKAYADRVSVLAEGRIVEEGPAGSVLGSPRHAATQALLANGKAHAD